MSVPQTVPGLNLRDSEGARSLAAAGSSCRAGAASPPRFAPANPPTWAPGGAVQKLNHTVHKRTAASGVVSRKAARKLTHGFLPSGRSMPRRRSWSPDLGSFVRVPETSQTGRLDTPEAKETRV